jgi:hypothetical protein
LEPHRRVDGATPCLRARRRIAADKARAVAARRDRLDSDRQDLIRLLSFVHDARALADEERLRSTQKKWLQDIELLTAFDDAALTAVLPASEVERARQAYRLLIG